jgi:hypothetical protein
MVRALLSALSASLVLGACGAISDPAGFALVTQDKYDFVTCKEAIAARNGAADAVKTGIERMEKNDGIDGAIVNTIAYRSELVMARGRLAAAERAIATNNCEPNTPKPQ